MSMYSQSSYPSTSYGQYSGYPSTSAAAAPPPQYYGGYSSSPPPPPAPYRPPPPSSQDVAIFRSWFAQQLAALVENNRAVIHRLAYIAREHVDRFAPIISECLEQHIRRVHPAIKLPSWYLLDSVSKNLGAPYTTLFSRFVAPLFLECYDLVDDSTRSKMEEMLVTWRTGGPGGIELFGQNAQLQIERAVWGDVSSGTQGPTPNQVLIELDVILTQKTRAVAQNPADMESRSHIEVLQQLRSLVQTSSMSSADLNAIVARLRDLARTTASTAPALPAMPPPPPTQNSFSPPPAITPFASVPTDALSSVLSSLISQPPPVITAPVPVPAPAAPAIPDVSALFKSLMAAGIISGNGTPVPASQQDDSPKFEPVIEPKPTVVDPKLVAMREYEKRVMSLPVSLSATGLQQLQPTVVSMMYEELSLKCKQCARRFADNETGQKARDNHLDLHFRQNKRASQAIGRGHCRSWFVGLEDWVHDVSDEVEIVDVKGKGRADAPPTSAKAIAAAAVERVANLRKMYVVVPPGDESKTINCPVCKEQLKTEFLEEEEEWVWRNAIMAKGKVYHATCHADALSSQTAARLRDQANRTPSSRSPRSRSGTPDSTLKPNGSPVRRTLSPPAFTGGKKRKSPSSNSDEAEVEEAVHVKSEPSEADEQSQPFKRARTSSPLPPAL